jgi:hypothetical protein
LIDGFKTTIPETLGRALIDLAVKMDDVFGHRLTSHCTMRAGFKRLYSLVKI